MWLIGFYTFNECRGSDTSVTQFICTDCKVNTYHRGLYMYRYMLSAERMLHMVCSHNCQCIYFISFYCKVYTNHSGLMFTGRCLLLREYNSISLLSPFVLLAYCTYDTCITLYCVYYLFEDCTCDITFYCVSYLFSLSIIFCSYILPTCTNLSVIVIDKPIGLGGAVYISTSIFVSHLCTIYHLNKRFETITHGKMQLYTLIITNKTSSTLSSCCLCAHCIDLWE